MAQLGSATDRASLAQDEAALRREASLRRIATLVAGGVTAEELFSAVAREVSVVVDVPVVTVGRYELEGGSPVSVVLASREHGSFPVGSRWPLDGAGTREIYEDRRPIRIEDFSGLEGTLASAARQQGMNWVVGAPIIVDGAVWGNIYAGTTGDEPIPDDVESRLGDFTDLVSTAIANSDAREKVGRLVDEQGALRRVATLVARGVQPLEVFAAVSEEVGWVFGSQYAGVGRYEPDGSAVVIVGVSEGISNIPIGTRWPLEDFLATAAVFRTGRPARNDKSDWEDAPGPVADSLRELGIVSTVAAPIVVEGNVWGAITVSDAHQRLPSDAEGRLAAFTELVATAIANAESRTELAVSEARAHDLAREQAALRRVATLVAKGASSDELFSAVANVVAGIFDVPVVGIHRYEADGTVTTLGIAGETSLTVGMRLRVTDEGIAAMMLSTGGPARIDDFAGVPRDAVREDLRLPMVGVPILVEGGIWGFMVAAAKPDRLIPADTEERLARFTELVATAVANSQARERVAQLADEQAALRRVAALVAGGASSTAVFDAVAQEVAQVFQVAPSLVACYEDDGATMRVLAAHPASFAFGSRWPLDGPSVAAEVLRSGRPVRMEDWTDLPGTLAAVAREHGLTRVAGAPIIVDGRVWGLVAVAGPPDERLPENLEDRLAEFTELLGTAMANAESRAELDASRARIVATADATRRRIERDLHDGIQQWLVAVTLKARKAAAFGPSGSPHEEFARIADDLETVLEELREISRGIHPAILSNAGLDDALEALARRSAIPVVLDIDFEGRYEPSVEATVYYVVAESITNAVKHANASVVAVRGAVRDGTIELEIQDDGVGGAEPSRGSGITGLKDRVDTLGGTISLSSPVGAGTTIRMRLPVSPPDEGNRLVGRSVDPGPVSSDSG